MCPSPSQHYHCLVLLWLNYSLWTQTPRANKDIMFSIPMGPLAHIPQCQTCPGDSTCDLHIQWNKSQSSCGKNSATDYTNGFGRHGVKWNKLDTKEERLHYPTWRIPKFSNPQRWEMGWASPGIWEGVTIIAYWEKKGYGTWLEGQLQANVN